MRKMAVQVQCAFGKLHGFQLTIEEIDIVILLITLINLVMYQ
jgi:hypothetical protein